MGGNPVIHDSIHELVSQYVDIFFFLLFIKVKNYMKTAQKIFNNEILIQYSCLNCTYYTSSYQYVKCLSTTNYPIFDMQDFRYIGCAPPF